MIRKLFVIFLLSIFFVNGVRAENLLASQLGIKTKEFKVVKNNLLVPFQITSTDRCSFGDLDALFLDLYHSTDHTKILLTVEDFLNPDQIYFTKDLNADKFDEKIIGKGGYQSSLELPKFPSAKILALYVCKDGSGKNHCSDKKVQDVNETINVYNADKTLPPGFYADDKVYFFSYLLVDKNKVSVVEPLGENEYPVFQEYLQSNSINASEAKTVTDKIKANNDLLGSEAVSFAEKPVSVNILLPRLNSKKCYRAKETK